MRVYLAGPLFSEAERTFNREVKRRLESFGDVYLPQEDGHLLVDLVAQGMAPAEAQRKIFDLDVAAVKRCDLLVAILDGRSVDEGTAFELGLAHALGKRCVGLQTDPRRLLPVGNNPMIEGALERICSSVDELVRVLKETSA